MPGHTKGLRALPPLPEVVRNKAMAAGDAGMRWLRDLDETVAALVQRWELGVGDSLPGSTESLVLAVKRSDGTPAVLKLGIPGVQDFEGEARCYALARGRGLAAIYAESPDDNALLIERLGVALAYLDWSVDDQIDAICGALGEVWQTPVAAAGLMTGRSKALWLKDFIDQTWQRLDQPCDPRARARALEFADERADAHTSTGSVLVHGDAHAHNALTVPGDTSHPCKLVDPDGLFAEPACDLAVPMREWSAALLPDPNRLGLERCGRLARLCGADERAIWQWGFMERVSTGMLLIDVGLDAEGREMLEVANHWAGVPSPA